ncbi:hypothetical protein IFM89_025266 [Coptis chinensis]|uniref:Uncharacterized protein n=1 Tax=Coptis chinensis TaxID=261450 RepID=A0A835M4X0_9MAGN|nr:hypothetical protein IFM89_025266 [Coptis chinensis]
MDPCSPATHPKIAQVLLERQNQDEALMVLRWYDLDGLCAYANRENGRGELVSLREARQPAREPHDRIYPKAKSDRILFCVCEEERCFIAGSAESGSQEQS